jgi:Concanavalin A-like lectin/glucanases superfamily
MHVAKASLRVLALLCTMVLSGPAIAQNNLSAFTNGLVGYWPFSGNANDASGNTNTGTIVGATPVADRFGMASNAFQFGVNQYIEVQDSPALRLRTSFTISAWIKLDSLHFPVTITEPDQHAIISKINEDGWSGGYELNFANPRVNIGGTFGGNHGAATVFLDDTNSWHFIAVSYTGTNLFMCLDGVITAATNDPPVGMLEASDLPLRIGRRISPYNEWWLGKIDDIRIYNRPLSTNEVDALFQAERPSNVPRAAKGTINISSGLVFGVTITDEGFGYTNAPAVEVVGGGGSGASLQAIISDGQVVGITVISPGSGYTNQPTLLIGSPDAAPKITVSVSRVNVHLQLILGKTYVIESSNDLALWVAVDSPFVATVESMDQEFIVSNTGRFFRVRQLSP